jgi:hypothetical protein
MSDFSILVTVTNRWPYRLHRPRSNAVCLLTVETDAGYKWAKRNFADADGMYWITRRYVGPLVRKIRSEGMSVKIDRTKK